MARIVIVGGGIVGLSVARAALKAGHQIVLLEQGAIPNPQAASCDDTRMIRPHYGAADGYTRMVAEAFHGWNALWQDLGTRHYAETGAIAISERPGDYAAVTLDTFRRLGVAHEVLDRRGIEALCPHLTLPAGATGVLAGPAGPLMARRIVADLAAWVAARGGVLRSGTHVAGIDTAAGRVTLESGETIEGDLVVVAAGAWLQDLFPGRYDALPRMRQALCYVEPPAAFAASWQAAPAIASIGDRGTYTLPGVLGAELKFGYGLHRRPGSPRDGFEAGVDDAEGVLSGFRDVLREADGYRPLRFFVGYYVMDASRRFRLEQHGRALVVTNCDGQMFKFGPLLGQRIVACFDGAESATDLARWAAGY
ncbi:MAG TPA: FAD-dependent oxidoreductase [Stellaceae bacterium]|nr:FAD-dependent oxidoreductase [Stellaceae bacterium]